MTTAFDRSFVRDLKRIRDRRVLSAIQEAIEAVDAATALTSVPGAKKLSGPAGYWRLRIGDYRVGLRFDGDAVVFSRVLHRREIYRFFP